MSEIYFGCEFRRISLVDETRYRHLDEIRIAQIVGTIAKAQTHGFDHDMHAVGCGELVEVEMFEDVERFQHDRAAG